MATHFFHSLVVVAIMLCTEVAKGESGLAPGNAVPPLKVNAVAGVSLGDDKDFAAERKEAPTIYVFVQAERFDRPVGRFLKVLDQKLAAVRPDVQVVAVWLTDDVEKSKQYLPVAQQSLKLEATVWSVYPGEKSGPANWNIDIAANVTVVVASQGKAIKSFEYGSINDTVVREVLQPLPPKK